MTTTDDGGPAFPVEIGDFRDYVSHPAKGMSLRDYFAAAALTGLMMDAKICPGDDNPLQRYAGWAYVAADAMLAKREKRNAATDV